MPQLSNSSPEARSVGSGHGGTQNQTTEIPERRELLHWHAFLLLYSRSHCHIHMCCHAAEHKLR